MAVSSYAPLWRGLSVPPSCMDPNCAVFLKLLSPSSLNVMLWSFSVLLPVVFALFVLADIGIRSAFAWCWWNLLGGELVATEFKPPVATFVFGSEPAMWISWLVCTGTISDSIVSTLEISNYLSYEELTLRPFARYYTDDRLLNRCSPVFKLTKPESILSYFSDWRPTSWIPWLSGSVIAGAVLFGSWSGRCRLLVTLRLVSFFDISLSLSLATFLSCSVSEDGCVIVGRLWPLRDCST